MMRRMKMICIWGMAFLFGVLGSVQVFAATEEKAQVKANEVHSRGHFRHDSEFIKKQAESMGIKTEGKDTETIAKEVRETHIKKVAKELGISTNGKELKEVVHEIRETQIKKEAKELGISIKNKDLREVAHEVREKRIFQAAEKLGIETKNKSANELFKEIMTNHADKVKELNLFPHKQDKLFFFDRSKEN